MKTEHLIIGGLIVAAVGGGVWYWKKSQTTKQQTATTVALIVPLGAPYTNIGTGAVPMQDVKIITSAESVTDPNAGAAYTFPATAVISLPSLIGKTIVQAIPMIAQLGGAAKAGAVLKLAVSQSVLGVVSCVGLAPMVNCTSRHVLVGQGSSPNWRKRGAGATSPRMA